MKYLRILSASLLLALGLQWPVSAHVKWFSSYSFLHKPLLIGEILSPLFWGLMLLSIVVIGLLVFADEKIRQYGWYKTICEKVLGYASLSDLIIRIAVGAVLVLSWHTGALLVPELVINNPWVDFIQLLFAVLILSNRFTAYAGAGLIALYLLAFFMYSSIHMLDYLYVFGAGYYLLVANHKNTKLQATALLALYATVGFSLCWVAQEKLFYPDWGLEILSANPQLALGLDPSFFLFSSAFVEFSLGFLLIFCVLPRPIALIITMVLMSTTLVFGKVEFVGHAIVHAALLVFFLRGSGTTFRTPITFFKCLHQRVMFAGVGFVVVLGIILNLYSSSALWQYEVAQTQYKADPHNTVIELTSVSESPEVSFEILEDEHSGWNLHLDTQNFRFSPADEAEEYDEVLGHAHLYVNQEKVARLYGPWYHMKELPRGKHEIKVTLTSGSHSEYAVNGIPIAAKKTLVVN